MIRIPTFAKGGKSVKNNSDAKQEAAMIMQVLNAIGIDETTATTKLNEIAAANDIETMNNITEAVNIILQSQNDNTAKQYVTQAVNYLGEVFGASESQTFKCGGKLESLVSRFKKGGSIDCGCGKKIQMDKCGKKIKKHSDGNEIDGDNDLQGNVGNNYTEAGYRSAVDAQQYAPIYVGVNGKNANKAVTKTGRDDKGKYNAYQFIDKNNNLVQVLDRSQRGQRTTRVITPESDTLRYVQIGRNPETREVSANPEIDSVMDNYFGNRYQIPQVLFKQRMFGNPIPYRVIMP